MKRGSVEKQNACATEEIMRKKLSRIVCVAAAAVLSVSMLAGCGNDGAKTAITVNGENIPYGEAIFMLRSNQAEVYYQMMSSGFYGSGTLWDDEYTPEGQEEPGTYGQYFKDSITDEICELVLMRQKAGDYGVALDETDIANTENLAEKFMESNGDTAKNLGMTKEYVADMLKLTALRPKMKDALTVDVDTNVSDEEADMTTVTYLRLPYAEEEEAEAAEGTEDTEEGEEETAPAKTNEELRADCEKVLEQFREFGETDYDALNEMADAVNEDFFGMTYSYAPSESVFGDAVNEAIASLSDGEVYDGVIEDTDYYYLIRLDKLHDPEKIESKKQQIIEQRRTDLFEETIQGWLDEAEVTEDKIWTDTTVSDSQMYLSTKALES